MLADARIAGIVPVSDIDASVAFYEDKLGLTVAERRDDLSRNREAEFALGGGALLLYESAGAGKSRHTLVGFRVDDVEATVAALRRRGVVFEEYDLPELRTVDGIATLGDVKAAWLKDPDGNILAVEELGRPA